MRGWQRMYAQIVLVAMAVGSALFAQAETLPTLNFVTDDNHPPYAYQDPHGRPAGVYVEIVRRVLLRMPAYHASIAAVPWRRALAMSEGGEASGIFPPHRFPGQRPYLYAFSEPLLDEVPIVSCRPQVLAALPVHARWPDDFVGLSVGVSYGVRMGGERFWALSDAGRIHVEQARGVIENLKKLAYGRVACVVNDRRTIQWAWNALVRAEPALSSARPIEATALPTEYGYLALGRAASIREPYQASFLVEFNQRLRELRASGELDRIIQQALDTQLAAPPSTSAQPSAPARPD